jgi:hypothetical protein
VPLDLDLGQSIFGMNAMAACPESEAESVEMATTAPSSSISPLSPRSSSS